MSRLSRKLSRGEIVRGVGASTFAPSVVETAGKARMDYVWLDFEHKGPSAADSRALENLVRAADGVDTELLVRLPTAEPWLVRKVLDTGIQNLLLPRIETATEVREATRASTFEYDGAAGTRGGSISAATAWGQDGYEPTGDTPAVGVMLETAAAVENLEEILAVHGLAFGYLGSADLSVSLGYPFEMDHPAVEDAIATIKDTCETADVPLGRSVSYPQEVVEAVSNGWQLLRYGDDLTALRRRIARFEQHL